MVHLGTKAPVGESEGVEAYTQGAEQGHDRGVAEPQGGALRLLVVTDGCATRSKAGLARTQPCPTRSVSSMRRLTSRALVWSSSRWASRR